MARIDPSHGWSLADLAARSGATLDGDGTVRIGRVGTLERAGPGEIAFLANSKYAAQLGTTRASAVIVSPEHAARTTLPKLVSPHPYLTYARVATLLHPSPPPAPGAHPSAVVDPSASIEAGASIGPHAVVGARATLGAGAVLGAGCVVGADASIGARSRLDANVVVYDRCAIGEDAIVCAGAVIGADGFGLAPEGGGRWLRIPQVGRAVVGDRVEIGANTTIDRGAIDDTVIGDDVKLDNQIQIGHNCVIGDGTAIAGCVGIAGSTRIGRGCLIGGAAMISGHLTIADGTTIGGGATVLSDVEEGGAYASALPLLRQGDWRRMAVRVRQLDALAARLTRVERALRDLDARD